MLRWAEDNDTEAAASLAARRPQVHEAAERSDHEDSPAGEPPPPCPEAKNDQYIDGDPEDEESCGPR